ncbi:MAG: creatininase family protein [candidate division Zixibacteria bacterium]|nr:creatininase family protein [candidate division Zixibacteria bacterium]
MKGAKLPYRYDHYTWVEIREVVKRQPVVVLPTGSTEDHGHHLPLDVDTFLVSSVCEGAAQLIPDEVLLLPELAYGFEDHHMDFPGTITIRDDHLLDFVLDITRSVGHHGFRKILIVNGHGSNANIMETVARRTVIETDVHCGMLNWWSMAQSTLWRIGDSDLQSHADEIETSVYRYLNDDAVQMDKAVKEVKIPDQKYYWRGWFRGKGASPLRMMDQWSRISETGVIGDATVATVEKGEQLYQAATRELAELIREFRTLPIEPRVDRH